MSQVPSIGRIVHYTLSAGDADRINRKRADGGSSGNQATEGQVFPLFITRIWGDTPGSAVNGQLMLDGDDTLWVTSATADEGPGHFMWPVFTR